MGAGVDEDRHPYGCICNECDHTEEEFLPSDCIFPCPEVHATPPDRDLRIIRNKLYYGDTLTARDVEILIRVVDGEIGRNEDV